eukprot:6928359-Pyramimonas_sp.AAC.1
MSCGERKKTHLRRTYNIWSFSALGTPAEYTCFCSAIRSCRTSSTAWAARSSCAVSPSQSTSETCFRSSSLPTASVEPRFGQAVHE